MQWGKKGGKSGATKKAEQEEKKIGLGPAQTAAPSPFVTCDRPKTMEGVFTLF